MIVKQHFGNIYAKFEGFWSKNVEEDSFLTLFELFQFKVRTCTVIIGKMRFSRIHISG